MPKHDSQRPFKRRWHSYLDSHIQQPSTNSPKLQSDGFTVSTIITTKLLTFLLMYVSNANRNIPNVNINIKAW